MEKTEKSEKKLAFFTEAIAREVEAKKRQARHQMTAAANEEIAQAANAASAEAKAQTQAQLGAIHKIMNKRLTATQTENRRNLATLQERLTAQLFELIRADVIAFTQSPEYEGHIIASVQAAQAQARYPYAYIQLTPNDMHLADAIKNATGLTPEPGEESMLGGYKLLTEGRNVGLEHSFSARITDARQKFSQELSIEEDE